MITVTQSAETKVIGTLKAADMRAFLNAIPADAEIKITEHRGDPRDPREAGHREVSIKATWTQESNKPTVRPRPPAMRGKPMSREEFDNLGDSAPHTSHNGGNRP